jgi:hypothetical protein
VTDPRQHRERLESLAERGVPRGADDVLGAAVAHAAAILDNGRREGAVQTATLDAGTHALPPAIDLDAPRRRPSRTHRGIAGLGIAALLGIGGYATLATQGGGGGADSPRAAVQQLADALGEEDALAALDVLAPKEIASLQASLDAAANKAEEFDLVEDATDPFRGFDLDVQGLELQVEAVADGLAKVSATSGAVDAAVDPDRLAGGVRDRLEPGTEPASGRLELADLAPEGFAPFVMTVRDGDGWYVSPAYTVLEYLRLDDGGPPVDFGSAVAAELGAESPELAAREFVEAIRDENWTKLASLVDPDQIPLYDYRATLEHALADADTDFTLERFSATAAVQGERATVLVEAGGIYAGGDATWSLADDCILQEGAGDQSSDPSADEIVDLDGGMCLAERGALPISLWLDTGTHTGPARVEAVQRDGRWFLNPVGTGLRFLDAWIANFDARALDSLTGAHERIAPSGTVTLGEPVRFTAEGWGLTYTYVLELDAPTEVVGRTTLDGSDSGVNAEIYDEQGDYVDSGSFYGYPSHLPAGRYIVVVSAYGGGTVELTIWDRDEAPAGVEQQGGDGIVFDEESECIVGDCTSAISTDTTMISG